MQRTSKASIVACQELPALYLWFPYRRLQLNILSTHGIIVFMVSVLQVTAQYFDYTWHHWCSDTQGILQVLQTLLAGPQSAILVTDQDQALRLTCERWMLCLKVLRRMLLHGFQRNARTVQVCFTNMLKAIKLSCE
jgi:hypothetical protein